MRSDILQLQTANRTLAAELRCVRSERLPHAEKAIEQGGSRGVPLEHPYIQNRTCTAPNLHSGSAQESSPHQHDTTGRQVVHLASGSKRGIRATPYHVAHSAVSTQHHVSVFYCCGQWRFPSLAYVGCLDKIVALADTSKREPNFSPRSNDPSRGFRTDHDRTRSSTSHFNVFTFDTLGRERLLRLRMLSTVFQSTIPTDRASRSLMAYGEDRAGRRLPTIRGPGLFEDRNLNPRDPVTQKLKTLNDVHEGLRSPDATEHTQIGSYDGPLHFVPVSRWSELVSAADDEPASCLISLFLTCLNPYWRLVEEDLFLQASREVSQSPYCSSFLINAILACASVRLTKNPNSRIWADLNQLYSETMIAFATSENYLTRGAHFHKAAVNLQAAHQGRTPTLCNVQALAVLSLS